MKKRSLNIIKSGTGGKSIFDILEGVKCPITKKRPNINDCVKHCNGPCDMLKNLSKHLEEEESCKSFNIFP